MSEEREPDLDHVREAMREHDERQEQNERREEPPPEEPEERGGRGRRRVIMSAMLAVRYVLPALLVVGGLVLVAIEPNTIGLEGLLMAIGAALSVLLLNLLFRAGVQGDRDREQEAAAREYYAEHGRWPDESR